MSVLLPVTFFGESFTLLFCTKLFVVLYLTRQLFLNITCNTEYNIQETSNTILIDIIYSTQKIYGRKL